MNEQTTLNIKLSVDQINVILSTLGKLPYQTIAPLIDNIQNQANQQISQLQQQEQNHQPLIQSEDLTQSNTQFQ